MILSPPVPHHFSFLVCFSRGGLLNIHRSTITHHMVTCSSPFKLLPNHLVTVASSVYLSETLQVENINHLLLSTITYFQQGALAHEIPDLSVILEALRYSCLHWASHLADAISYPYADVSPVLEHLRTFTNEHLLHWFACLSACGELETGLTCLARTNESLSVSA